MSSTIAHYRMRAPGSPPIDALAASIGFSVDDPATVVAVDEVVGVAGTFDVALALPADRDGDVLRVADAVLDAPFGLAGATGLRLRGLQPGAALLAGASGPAFGIAGTRELVGVPERPLLGSIIKPSVGLTTAQTAARAALLARAGLDVMKDDELLADQPHAPLIRRAEAVSRALDAVARDSGRHALFAFNVSADDLDRVLAGHDAVVAAGGRCVMVSLNHVGLGGLTALRRHATVPIHGHRNGWGFLARSAWGVDYAAQQILWRLAGVDHLHVNGWANKFWEPDASVAASMRALLEPLGTTVAPMPVISSGQWGGQAPAQFATVPTQDFMYLAGGGVQGHPDGPAAGVRAVTAAWSATVAGVSLEDEAGRTPELRRSIAAFGAGHAR